MRSFWRLTPALLLAVAAACGPGEPPTPPEPTPETITLGLFELAAQDDPDPERIAAAFGAVDDEQEYAALLDAVRALAGGGETTPEIVESYTMEDGDRTGFDLEGTVGDGGVARYSVLLNTAEPPGTIVWFSGPGIEWPDRRRRGPGISTSAPPRSGEEG